MIIEGGGFPIRDKLLKIVDAPDKTKDKKNGKAKSLDAEGQREDVLEVAAENIEASKAKVKDFDQAVELLRRTKGLIASRGSLSEAHAGLVSSSLVKLIVS